MMRLREPSVRWWRLALAVALCISMTPALGLAAEEPSPPPNPSLAVNGGFEDAAKDAAMPAGWRGDHAVCARDESVARTGKASLRYVNADPQRYLLCTQEVPVKPGTKCLLSAWVKTKDIAGKDSGATICLEWTDKAGQYMGGVYPSGVKGTRDWPKVAIVALVPAGAGGCTLACYVRKGLTGTAWFDDVELTYARDPVMRTVLASPGYRGRITAAGPEAVRLLVCPRSSTGPLT